MYIVYLSIGLYCENVIAIESEARYPFGGNMYYVTMQITLPIPEFTRNERNLHCDVYTLPTIESPDSFWMNQTRGATWWRTFELASDTWTSLSSHRVTSPRSDKNDMPLILSDKNRWTVDRTCHQPVIYDVTVNNCYLWYFPYVDLFMPTHSLHS